MTLKTEILELIDSSIKENINNNTYKPSEGYKDFVTSNNTVLEEEYKRLITVYSINEKEAEDKIKKTYKNRYYLTSKNINKETPKEET